MIGRDLVRNAIECLAAAEDSLAEAEDRPNGERRDTFIALAHAAREDATSFAMVAQAQMLERIDVALENISIDMDEQRTVDLWK